MDRILNGLTRPFFGWVSDQIGRENTMFIAFVLEGVAIFLLSAYGQNPVLFVVLSAFVFFAWEKFTVSSPPPTPTPMARNMRRPMLDCSIPPREPRHSLCRFPVF